MTINLIISSVIQLLLLSLIPFLWWLAAGRKPFRSFPAWLAITAIVLSGLGLAMSVFILDAEVLASHQFHGLGMAGLVPVLIYSFLQTALSVGAWATSTKGCRAALLCIAGCCMAS